MSRRSWGLVGTLRDDIYGLWTLDESTGTRYNASSGSGPDLSESGGAVPAVAGRFGAAASSTEGDTFALAGTLSTAIAMADGLTVSFWFKWPASPSTNPDSMLFLENVATTGAEPNLHLLRYYDSNYLSAGFAWGGGANAVTLPIPRLGALDVDEWHFLVLTYDAATGIFTGRVDDGCLSGAVDYAGGSGPSDKLSATVPTASLAAANAITFDTLKLLKAFNGNFVNFEGAIDDLRIWTRVLTATETELLYLGAEVTLTQRYEKVVQEDLNIGTDTVWVTAPGSGKLLSTQIGLHSVARGQKEYTAAWTPGAIAAGSKASTTVAVTDAAIGDFVLASHDKMLTSDLRISGNVSASGTAQVVIHNPTASSVTVAAGTVSVLVFQFNGPSAARANITGTVTFDEFPYGAAPGPAWPSITVSLDLDGVPWAGGTETTDANGVYTFANVPAATSATVTVGPAIPPGEVQQFNDSNSSAHDGINDTTIDLYAQTGGV